MCLFLFSQVIYGPRRGPTFNNRWWNDRREWNLRISIREGEGVPKGGEQHPVLLLFAPFGDGRESISYPQVPFPSVIPPAVIHIRPLRGRQREYQLSAGSILFGHSTSGYSHSPPSGTAVRMPYCFLFFLFPQTIIPFLYRFSALLYHFRLSLYPYNLIFPNIWKRFFYSLTLHRFSKWRVAVLETICLFTYNKI